MNLLGILSLLLIASNSVLCRRIHRQDPKDEADRELPDLPETREETIQNTNFNLELENINVTTSRADILQENETVTGQDESTDSISFGYQGKLDKPMSKKRIQKMLKKAVVEIITGDLTPSDISLLKSLNYDAEQVRKIREEEFEKKKNIQEIIHEKIKPRNRTSVDNEKSKGNRDWEKISQESNSSSENVYDYEAFNKQATFDYEYAASNFELTNGSWDESGSEYEERMKSSTETLPDIGGSLKKNVVFTISYNDSEFDSSSEENSSIFGNENHESAPNSTGNNFLISATSDNSSPAPRDDQIDTLSELYNVPKYYFSTTENAVEENNEIDSQIIPSRNQNEDLKVPVSSTQLPESHFRYETDQQPSEGEENRTGISVSLSTLSSTTETPNITSNFTSDENRTNTTPKYKGLRWVQDNVYQVIPEYIDFLPSEVENQTIDSSYDDSLYQNIDDVIIRNPTITEDLNPDNGTPNIASDSAQLLNSNGNVTVEDLSNMTAYQRRQVGNISSFIISQRQKTEADIKVRILSFTGRLNSTGNNNPLQPRREKLVMFSPTCGMPRNADSELWQDSHLMNMQFILNLTSNQHLVAARLRLFRIPQENSTTTTSTILDGVENEDKKIRISVYYYTKPLKKHHTIRKRLIDSKVASLITTGDHLALDVKDAVRHWRHSSGSRNTNHGLVVLVEDQEGRPLQPSHYIQTSNCNNHTNLNLQDEKAYQRVPALFICACTRYVHIVGNKVEEYCGSNPEPGSHHQGRAYCD